jgi:hypothetical protein
MNAPRIESVTPLNGKCLLVAFNNGIQKIYDCNQIIHLERFRFLKDDAFFNMVMVDTGGYGLSWSDEVDLSEYELWHNGLEIAPENLYVVSLQGS